MTARPHLLVSPLRLLVALLVLLAGVASGTTVAEAGNGVAAINVESRAAVGAVGHIAPDHVGWNTGLFDDFTLGCCVAPRSTLSGRTVLGENWDEAIRAGRGAKPLDGFHDVVAHGSPTGMYDEVGNLLGPSDAAAVIRNTPSWGGQDVRLLSCSTGCPSGNFAQGLADELGVAVRAPTVDFYVNSRGVPVLDPGGEWLTHLPGGG